MLLRKLIPANDRVESLSNNLVQKDSFETEDTAVSVSETEASAKTDGHVAAKTSAWLVSAPLDYLFVCGFAPWILGFFAYLYFGSRQSEFPSPEQTILNILFIALSFLVGESHQFTSILRYATDERQKAKSPSWQNWFLASFLEGAVSRIMWSCCESIAD
jgi:hypothetical protein